MAKKCFIKRSAMFAVLFVMFIAFIASFAIAGINVHAETLGTDFFVVPITENILPRNDELFDASTLPHFKNVAVEDIRTWNCPEDEMGRLIFNSNNNMALGFDNGVFEDESEGLDPGYTNKGLLEDIEYGYYFYYTASEASDSHWHKGVTFDAWTSDNSLPTEDGDYYLTKDVKLSSNWVVPTGTTNLCLNGHGITLSDCSILVTDEDELNLYDCGESISYITKDTNENCVVSTEDSEGALKVVGGYIAGAYHAFKIHGGTFTMNGGTICFSASSAIYLAKNEEYSSVKGTFILNGGNICHNSWIHNMSGAVDIENGDFIMNGGKISDNEALWGAGVCLVNSTFTMNGGTISNNHANNEGGGIHVSGSTFTLNGGTITNNVAGTAGDTTFVGKTQAGGGIFINYKSAFHISGSPVVENNTKIVKNVESPSNVYLENQSNNVYITIDDALTNEKPIGVSKYNYNDPIFTDTNGENYKDKFAADSPTLDVEVDATGALKFIEIHPHENIKFKKWTSDNSLPTEAGNYALTQDVHINSWYVPAGTTNLCLNGYAILFEMDDGIHVYKDSTLNLYDCDDSTEHIINNYEGFEGPITIVGGYIAGSESVAIGVTGGTFNMYGGNICFNSYSVEVWLYDTGEFNMYGGNICYNNSNVYVGIGSFNMYGGSISHNISSTSGGGIYLTNSGKFTMTGGSITDNVSEIGGGIYFDDGELHISGSPVIKDNKDSNGNNSNVYLTENKLIAIDDVLTSSASIGISMKIAGIFTNVDVADYKDNFNSDNSSYIVMVTENDALKLALHTHSLTYSADGATITATCSSDGCFLPESKATITLEAPKGSMVYDGNAKVATFKDEYDTSVFVNPEIKYYKGTVEVAECVNPGLYKATVTYGDVTAEVEFNIYNPIFVAGVNIDSIEGKVVDSDTTGIVGTVSGSATLTYDNNGNFILTLNNFAYSGTGYELNELDSASIYFNLLNNESITIVLNGENSLSYESFAIYVVNENGDISNIIITGDGSLNIADEFGGDRAIKSINSDLTIKSGTINVTGNFAYVYDGNKLTIEGGEFNGLSTKGKAITVNEFVMTGGKATFESQRDEIGYGLRSEKTTITGGELTLLADKSGMGDGYQGGKLTITGGSVIVKAHNVGLRFYVDDALEMNGGTLYVESLGAGVQKSGSEEGKLTINGGYATIIGEEIAIYSNESAKLVVQNSIKGLAWTDTLGTLGETKIIISTEGQEIDSSFKKVYFNGHEHTWTYTANGATITAACDSECDITEGLELTLVAPTGNMVYDGNARVATIQTGYNEEAFANPEIKYYKGTEEVTECKAAGTYTAKVTFGTATAEVTFTIENWTMPKDDKGVIVIIEGVAKDETIELEVEVRADVSSEEAQAGYMEAINKILATDEKIALIYNVKLIQTTNVGGVETKKEIQPSDIKEGTSIIIQMNIPEALRGKSFKLLHVHSATDIEFVTDYKISDDGTYLTVKVNKLSDFAFVETVAPQAKDHGFCIGYIALILAIILVIYTVFYIFLYFNLFTFLSGLRNSLSLINLISIICATAICVFGLVVLIVHNCPVSITAFIISAIDFIVVLVLFILALLKKKKENKQ